MEGVGDTEKERTRELVDRLKELHTAGLLNGQDYSHYRKLLRNYPSDYYIRQIHKNLDQLANAMDPPVKEQMPSLMDQTQENVPPPPPPRTTEDSPPPIIGHHKSKSRRKNRVSWEDESDGETPAPAKVILDPHDLWSGTIEFDEQQLQDLFVEMCFFARLGYVQPPCCLKCTYQETMEHEDNTPCTRWVVWRKDAATLLHPNMLDGNIIIVQCDKVSDLLQGDTVEGRKWDAARKQIVSVDR